jgi:signal transduction histidine kinase
MLLSLVNDILDYSKIESGKITLYYDKFCPEKLINECIQLFSFQASQKMIKLKSNIDPNVPKYFVSDENRFK